MRLFALTNTQLKHLAITSLLLNTLCIATLLLKTTVIFPQNLPTNETLSLLSHPLQMTGNKSITTNTISIPADTFKNKDMMTLAYNLHGLCLLPGKASEVSVTDIDGHTFSTTLKKFGQNCSKEDQIVSIPLSTFGINKNIALSHLTISFWNPTDYRVDIADIVLSNNVLGAKTHRVLTQQARPTIQSPIAATPPLNTHFTTSIPTQTIFPKVSIQLKKIVPPSPLSGNKSTWQIQSVSSMKETKDKVCSPDTNEFINQWISTAKDLGVNYIAVETPYDNPACGDAVIYTKNWVTAIHANGLHVWHRHMPLAFEGIYDTPKNSATDYINQITEYIKNNPGFFQQGDIFTPIPEPQNGGIQGITYCPQDICIFKTAEDFNNWLRTAMTSSENAFGTIGLGNKMKIGYFGFDGFVTWGDNNPDWNGILEDATILQMGEITIDHYPELVDDTMQHDLDELQTKYPTVQIIIGEWGTVTGGDIADQVNTTMKAAIRPNIMGFNYWHMGMGGNEALINDDFSHRPNYDAVKKFFRPQ